MEPTGTPVMNNNNNNSNNPIFKAPFLCLKASCEVAAEWVAALALLEEMLDLQLQSSAPWRRS